MSERQDPPRDPHPDPEVEALLGFEPVVRRYVRHDGWLADRQRDFIVALTVLGSAQQAAIAVGGTMSGAYKLRSAEGGESFAASWDSALALHHRRHPRPEPKGRPSRGEIESRWNDSIGTTLESGAEDAARRHLAPHGWTRGKHV